MNRYDKAVAAWIANKVKVEPDKVTDIHFKVIYGGFCETCGYETFGFEYKMNNKFEEIEIGDYNITPAQFMEECVALLEPE